MAVVNPFQQINASLPPLAPAPPPLGFDPGAMDTSGPPQMPQSKRPEVFKQPTPQDRQESAMSQRLEKDYQKDQPYDRSQHSTLGNIGHVFATIGNTAGDIFAPNAMARIPGTQAHRQVEETSIEDRLNKLAEMQSQDAYRGAETGKTQEEIAEMPGKTQSEEGLQGAQTAEAQSKVDNPDLATAYSHRINQVLKKGGDPSTDPVVQHIADSITAIQKQPLPKGMEKVDLVGPNGKPIAANYDPTKGTYTDAAGKPIENPQPYEKPNLAGQVTMIVPDPNNPGGGVVERLGAGAKVAPGAQTTAGFNAMNTPTTTQRTAAGRAETVIAMAPEVLSRIDSVAPKMGPISGRWNDFMQGKVGSDDPDFAALRSDLLMMSSAVALAHAQGRLPENLREEFDRAINAPKQTPENLKATIQTMIPWLQKVQQQGGRPGAEPKVMKFNATTGRLE
jgi:hypothetical protein